MFVNGRTEEICRQMDDLTDEDHTHHFTPEEIHGYRNNWWIRSNKIGSDTMPIRHRSESKQALSTLRQKKKEEEEEAQRNHDGHKAILRLGGAGKDHGGLLIPTKVTMETNPVLIDQGNLINK